MPQSRHLHSISDNHLSAPTHNPAIPAGIVAPFASRTARSPLEFLTILYACFIGLISLVYFSFTASDTNRMEQNGKNGKLFLRFISFLFLMG